MTPSKEDFLKAIVELGGQYERVANKDLARKLGISSAAVSEMTLKLEEDGFITYTPYKGSTITEAGLKETNKLIRKHRIWEVFLHDKLNYDWNQVHADADLLEHVSSDFLIERLYQFLGEPAFDPHGGSIPDQEGNYSRPDTITLDRVPIGCDFIIKEVSDETAFLEHLQAKHIHLGDRYSLKAVDEYEGILTLTDRENQEKRIGLKTAARIKVELAGKN